jgi:hypothetical protein
MLTGTTARIHIVSPSPNDGDLYFDVELPIVANAGATQPTDAELIDIGNRLLASDYVQNQAWGGTAALDTIDVPSARTVYP